MANWGIETVSTLFTTGNWYRAMGETSSNIDNIGWDPLIEGYCD